MNILIYDSLPDEAAEIRRAVDSFYLHKTLLPYFEKRTAPLPVFCLISLPVSVEGCISVVLNYSTKNILWIRISCSLHPFITSCFPVSHSILSPHAPLSRFTPRRKHATIWNIIFRQLFDSCSFSGRTIYGMECNHSVAGRGL